jgi:hypothetical protein
MFVLYPLRGSRQPVIRRIFLLLACTSLCGSIFFSLSPTATQSIAGASSLSLASTTSNIHQALPYNSNEPTVNGPKQQENGVIDYVWGASGTPYTPYPGGNVWHEYYQPWPQGAQDAQYTTPWFQANHPDWLMYKSDRKTLAYWGQDYINSQTPTLDYANPAARQFIENNYLLRALAGGYNGISFDHAVAYNEAGAAGHYDLNGNWVQQYSGTYQDSAWASANTTALSQIRGAVKAQYPSATITNNQRYDCTYDPSLYKQSVPYADMMFDEEGFTDGGNSSFPYVVSWSTNYCSSKWLAKAQELQYIQQTLGKGLVLDEREPYTITAYMTDTNSQARFDLQWNLANYLLLKYDHTYFWWGSESQYGSGPIPQHEYSAQMGSATDDFYASQNVYMRDYTGGLALVNPSPGTAYTITLPAGKYVDLYGNAITTYTMGAHSGLVLLLAAPSSATATSTPTSTPTNAATSTPTSTPTAAAQVPGAPSNIVASSGHLSATVSWSPPTSGGSSSILSYKVRAYYSTGTTLAKSVLVGGTSTTMTVTGLVAGKIYTFTVQAANAAGPGPESVRSSPVKIRR